MLVVDGLVLEKASSKYIESSVHKRLSIESLSFFRLLEEEDIYVYIYRDL